MHTLKIILLLSLLLPTCSASANVYKWRDKQGKLHFTDQPPKDLEATKLDEQQLASQISSFTNVTVQIQPVEFGINRQANIPVMYTTTRCGYCAKARRFFAAENIAFEEKNIDLSEAYRQEFKAIGGKGVPLIIYARKRMNGFNPQKYKQTFSR